jgi:hypothetical protein
VVPLFLNFDFEKMERKKINILFGILLLTTLFNACKKGQLGNNICENTSITTPLTLSTTTPTLQNNKLNIKAGFSDGTEWWLRISGKSSGAFKEYRGKSDSLNIDWYGNSGTDIFFGAEECSIEFELNCKGIVDTKTFTITGKPNFKSTNFSQVYNDFDGTGFYDINNSVYAYPADTSLVHIYRADTITTDPSPQGGKSMEFSANTKNNATVFFFGGFGKTISSNAGNFIVKTKQSNTDSIYLNVYVRGYNSTHPNSQLVFSYLQNNDAKNYSIDIDWDGWKMISVKLSSFLTIKGYYDFNGTESFDMGLGAGPLQSSKGKYKIDFMILTAGTPYKDIQIRNY